MCVLAPTLARLYLYLRRQQAGSTEGGINSRQFQLQLLAWWAYLLCSLRPCSPGAARRVQCAHNGHHQERRKKTKKIAVAAQKEREGGRESGRGGGEIE